MSGDHMPRTASEQGREIPAEYEGKLEPNYYCRAWNGKAGREKYCRSRAGRGTEHSGTGRCCTHDGGGDARVVHGQSRRYSISTPELRELLAAHEADTAPLDTLSEIALMRALLQIYLESNGKGADPELATRLAGDITKAVERVQRAAAQNAISIEALRRFFLALERILIARVRDEDLRTRISEDIIAIQIT